MVSGTRPAASRILIVRLDNIGDVIMLTPAIRALRKVYPASQITALVSPAGSQALDLIPSVDDRIEWKAVWQDASMSMPLDPSREMKLIKQLAARQFDAALIFTSFSQSPYPPGYLCYLAGIPFRAGLVKDFGGSVFTISARSPADDCHQVDRNLTLLSAVGIDPAGCQMELSIPAWAIAGADVLLAEAGILPDQPLIVAAVGASCSARRYPPERFGEVIRLLAEKVDYPILLIGTQQESVILKPLMQVLIPNKVISLIGKTSLSEASELVRRSKLVITNNSASLHIADAFRVPQIVLYSGTDYLTQWQPRFSEAVIFQNQTTCSPCYQLTCPYQMQCIDIEPSTVADAAYELIAQHSVKCLSTDYR